MRKTRGIILRLGGLFLGVLAAALIGCSSGGGSGDSSGGGGDGGTVAFNLMDASTTHYKAVYVTIARVEVCRLEQTVAYGNGECSCGEDCYCDGDGDCYCDETCRWQTAVRPNKTYNLLELVNGVMEQLGITELEAGYYKIRLIIGTVPDDGTNILGNPHPQANYIIDRSNNAVPLKVPSGIQTGIKLVKPFQVQEDGYTELVLDFDACRSVVKAGNSGKYILKPVIKVIDTVQKALVYGAVTDDDPSQPMPIPGAPVTAQQTNVYNKIETVSGTLTDDGGKYQLILTPGESYAIVAAPDKVILGSPPQMFRPACAYLDRVEPDDYLRDFALVAEDAGEVNVDVTLDKVPVNYAGVVALSVRQELNCDEGPPNLPVEVRFASVQFEGNPVTFTIDLPYGNYQFVVTADDYKGAGLGILEVNQPSEELNISLQ